MAGTKTMTLSNGEEIDFRLVSTRAEMKEILDLADATDTKKRPSRSSST